MAGRTSRVQRRAYLLQALLRTTTASPTTLSAEEAESALQLEVPYLGNIFQMGNVYRSNYNGLQVTLNARNYHGLSMVAGYTYSSRARRRGRELGFRLRLGLAAGRT